jgi:nucleoside-diphosphate-sugar epimerase
MEEKGPPSMRILVTSGDDKIGGYVLRELRQAGHDLRDFGRTAPLVPGVPFVHGDATDIDQILAALPGNDAVVHLAAVAARGKIPPE